MLPFAATSVPTPHRCVTLSAVPGEARNYPADVTSQKNRPGGGSIVVPSLARRSPCENCCIVQFPTTRRSAVFATRSPDEAERRQGFEVLVEAYWRPAYKYVRIQWQRSIDDAQDLTQAFFTRAIEKDFFAGYDPQLAAFRTYLRTCLDGFLANEQKSAGRLKRGGDAAIVSLDFESAEGELAQHQIADELTTEEYFRREWVRSLFGLAVEDLRRECEERRKLVPFRLFERYDLDGDGVERLTYDQLASEFNLPVTSVTNHLAWARREFRRILLDRLREITGSEQEFRVEARALLGVDPS